MSDLFAAAGVSMEPLEGGWSGETFLAEAGGERSVVRIFGAERHRPEAPEVQAVLLGLVRGLLPVPAVREVRRGDPEAGTPGLLVVEHLPGVRGDLLLPDLDDAGARQLGAAVGQVAATLAAMPTLRAGLWADADLRIEPFAPTDLLTAKVEGLAPAEVEEVARQVAEVEEVAQQPSRDRSPAWSAAEVDRLLAVVTDAQTLLDAVTRTCVVHSDLNPKNLLVDPATLAVTGVLDWEYCHSGHPFTDLGNVLRFDRRPSYVDGVLDAWSDRHGGDRDASLALARAADLYALVDLAARAASNPVAARAERQLRAIAATGDLHAW